MRDGCYTVCMRVFIMEGKDEEEEAEEEGETKLVCASSMKKFTGSYFFFFLENMEPSLDNSVGYHFSVGN